MSVTSRQTHALSHKTRSFTKPFGRSGMVAGEDFIFLTFEYCHVIISLWTVRLLWNLTFGIYQEVFDYIESDSLGNALGDEIIRQRRGFEGQS